MLIAYSRLSIISHFSRAAHTMAGGGLIAVTQMTATSDREATFTTCRKLIETAASRGAKMVFLPEAYDYIGENPQQSISWAKKLDEAIQPFKELAVKHGVWLSLGGFHEAGEEPVTKAHNNHVIITSDGQLQSTYRKTHLYFLNLPDKGIRLVESDFTHPGQRVTPPVQTPVGKVGMCICYDLRFPELSIALTRQGADILTYPSAFTVPTGLAHWEVLLRARAIENQCYVVAAAQTGKHNAKRASYGHAMIVDPWGAIVAQCHEGTDVAIANVDLEYLNKIREEMPVWEHRRYDLYNPVSVVTSTFPLPADDAVYHFGRVKIEGKFIFKVSSLSYASVNRKCVVPGHVLVIPQRIGVERFEDLTKEEVSDLYCLVQDVQKAVETMYEANSSTVAVQDGEHAGQTVKHVHVHVMPRKAGDFIHNDEVYSKLQSHDKGEEVVWREEPDMQEECNKLRLHWSSHT